MSAQVTPPFKRRVSRGQAAQALQDDKSVDTPAKVTKVNKGAASFQAEITMERKPSIEKPALSALALKGQGPEEEDDDLGMKTPESKPREVVLRSTWGNSEGEPWAPERKRRRSQLCEEELVRLLIVQGEHGPEFQFQGETYRATDAAAEQELLELSVEPVTRKKARRPSIAEIRRQQAARRQAI
eukprot:TRINITY_DN79464_c0_g1_i1.p1 TRINITY_DN79464_c0_g1~~TRINITY_DN79464_c0_g1_i1.p1  ORF type:complete len:185 (-),score=41.03 TRINITY_DN79464_c0_g1_i1:104-658(-)